VFLVADPFLENVSFFCHTRSSGTFLVAVSLKGLGRLPLLFSLANGYAFETLLPRVVLEPVIPWALGLFSLFLSFAFRCKSPCQKLLES